MGPQLFLHHLQFAMWTVVAQVVMSFYLVLEFFCFTSFLYWNFAPFFFFLGKREMRTSWHGLAFWCTSTWLWLGFVISGFFFFFSHYTHSPIKINRPLNFEVWCNLWEIIRSATQTPQFGEGKEVRKIDQIIYCTWAG